MKKFILPLLFLAFLSACGGDKGEDIPEDTLKLVTIEVDISFTGDIDLFNEDLKCNVVGPEKPNVEPIDDRWWIEENAPFFNFSRTATTIANRVYSGIGVAEPMKITTNRKVVSLAVLNSFSFKGEAEPGKKITVSYKIYLDGVLSFTKTLDSSVSSSISFKVNATEIRDVTPTEVWPFPFDV